MISSIMSAFGGMQREVKRFEASTRELAMLPTNPPPVQPAEAVEPPLPAGTTGLETSVSLPLPNIERNMTNMILASELYKANINVIEMSDDMMKSTLDMKV